MNFKQIKLKQIQTIPKKKEFGQYSRNKKLECIIMNHSLFINKNYLILILKINFTQYLNNMFNT